MIEFGFYDTQKELNDILCPLRKILNFLSFRDYESDSEGNLSNLIV